MDPRGLNSTATRSGCGLSARRRALVCLLALACAVAPALASGPQRPASAPPPHFQGQPRGGQQPFRGGVSRQSRPAPQTYRARPQQNHGAAPQPYRETRQPQPPPPNRGAAPQPYRGPAQTPPPQNRGAAPQPYRAEPPRGHLGDWLQHHQGQSPQDQTKEINNY